MRDTCISNKKGFDSIPPMLSVIIPVYNVESYICQCLDSIVNQTFKDIEVICIDDGSSDNSGTICDEYAKLNQGISVTVIHKKNEGVVKARNDGMRVANGEYLTFVDADDWLDTDYFERMFAALGESNAEIFCSGGMYIEKIKVTQITKTFESPFLYHHGQHRAEMMARVLTSWPTGRKNELLCDLGYMWDKIYKTSFVKEKILGQIDCSDYALWEDALFELETFSKAETIGGCLEIGYHYRKDIPDSALTRYREDLTEICKHWADDVYKYLEKDPAFNDPSLQKAFFARCQMMLIIVLKNYMHPDNKASYREKAREYRDLKKTKYFRESVRHRTPYRTSMSNVKITVMRWTGLWSQYLIKWVRHDLKRI